MNDVAFSILKIVVSVCSALVTLYVIPYLHALKQNEKYAGMAEAVEVAVRAAEQTIKGSGQGAAKKERVLQIMSQWLTDRGFKIDALQIDELIEAAVYDLNQNKEAA